MEAAVIRDRTTQKSKGYGFVTFSAKESAEAAVFEANPMIDGRKANCNLAAFGKKRSPGNPKVKNKARNNRPISDKHQYGGRPDINGTSTVPVVWAGYGHMPQGYGYQQVAYGYPDGSYPVGFYPQPQYVYPMTGYQQPVQQQMMQHYQQQRQPFDDMGSKVGPDGSPTGPQGQGRQQHQQQQHQQFDLEHQHMQQFGHQNIYRGTPVALPMGMIPQAIVYNGGEQYAYADSNDLETVGGEEMTVGGEEMPEQVAEYNPGNNTTSEVESYD